MTTFPEIELTTRQPNFAQTRPIYYTELHTESV
jgi:hypothetical protein